MTTHFSGVYVLLLFGMLLACKKDQDTAASSMNNQTPAEVFYVKTAAIETSAPPDVIHATGMIQSDTEAKPSFKVGGVIARVFVKEGDHVKKGQLLARLNMTEIEAQAIQADIALEKALRDLQRAENLYRDSIATLEQWQNAKSAAEAARKTKQIADFNVAYAEVRSPIDGKVVSQLQQEGEITGPGIPVFYVMGVQPSDWKIVAGLTDKAWGRIQKGDPAIITMDAYPGWSVTGKVIRLSDVASPLSGTFDAEISIPSKNKRIAAGLLAHVEIQPSVDESYPMIPIEALVTSNGRTGVVFIPNGDRAEKRVVSIRHFYGEKIAIQSGLENITEIITAGSEYLEDGDRIVIQDK